LIIFMPLAMIRNLAKLSGTALVADAFILIGCECPHEQIDGVLIPNVSDLHRVKRDGGPGSAGRGRHSAV
jgi:hypothetical protein